MKIKCPHCGVQGNVADEKIPPGGATLKCPKCSKPFKVSKPAPAQQPASAPSFAHTPGSCPGCGRQMPTGASICQYCGFNMETGQPGKQYTGGTTLKVEKAPDGSAPRNYQPTFTGSAGQFFRIWIVNLFLTIITLGIYAAWAKVRNRQYLYSHTDLQGHTFEYLANPIAILKGHLIIALGIGLFYGLNYTAPEFAGVVILLFYLLFPFLIYKSIQFFARYSAYRNIRFRFRGTCGQSYVVYLLWALLIPLTLGLIIPYWELRKKRYFFDNFSYGNVNNSFVGEAGFFYITYLIVFGIFMGVGILFNMFIPMMMVPLFMKGANPSAGFGAIIIAVVGFYLGFILLSIFIQQFIYTRFTNYCYNNSEMGPIRFISTLHPFKLFWIRVSNMFAILFSVGLLIPWAKIRRLRYIYENLTIVTTTSLDSISASQEEEYSAIGDAATDFFDLDIGL